MVTRLGIKIPAIIEHGREIDNCIVEGWEGIPLTPEWLERMGFIHNPIVLISRQYLIKLGRDRMLSVSDAGTPNEIVFIQEVDGKKVTDLVCIHNFDYDGKLHVHHLQNLFHALTGKELEVKP